MPERSAYLENGRVRAYCACSRCVWGLFGYIFLSSFISLFFFPLSGVDGWVTCGLNLFFNRILVISGRWVGGGWRMQ